MVEYLILRFVKSCHQRPGNMESSGGAGYAFAWASETEGGRAVPRRTK